MKTDPLSKLSETGLQLRPAFLYALISGWVKVVRKESAKVGLREVAWSICKAIFRIRYDRDRYRQRIAICEKCFIYDPIDRSCRRGPLGCGCYVPLKALDRGPCWGREVIGKDQDGDDVGWG